MSGGVLGTVRGGNFILKICFDDRLRGYRKFGPESPNTFHESYFTSIPSLNDGVY